MATIKFLLQSSSERAQIYVRLSISQHKSLKKKTGFFISPADWNQSASRPKQTGADNKILSLNLKKLDSFISARYNADMGNGTSIDSFWLETQINDCFNRSEKQDATSVVNHVQHIIDNANTRKIQGRKKLGISDSRVKSYQTFKKVLCEFESEIRKPIHFADVDKRLVDRFTNWLINTKVYSTNYSGKQIDNLKTVCLNASKLGITSNAFFKNIESFSEGDEDRYIITLSFDELKQIELAEIKSEALANARKWILLGCELGQRAGDLLNLTEKSVRHTAGLSYVDVLQQKTGKLVTIPVTGRVSQIIESGLPYKISTQKLNKYVKDVCEISQINAPTEGKKLDPKTRRKVKGLYPKFELATTHTFRRSYSSNYYKHIPTPILMAITGHGKESTFLEYINKRNDKDSNADLFMQFYTKLNAGIEPQLKVV
ncbi:MAG TPA: phage integrase SAM-like domain-containing protein [Flavobacterium sp.]|jgi:integrase